MLTLPIIETFLDYIEAERNFSAHTVRSYTADLIQFARYLGAGPDEEISAEDLPPIEELDAGRIEQALLATEPM